MLCSFGQQMAIVQEAVRSKLGCKRGFLTMPQVFRPSSSRSSGHSSGFLLPLVGAGRFCPAPAIFLNISLFDEQIGLSQSRGSGMAGGMSGSRRKLLHEKQKFFPVYFLSPAPPPVLVSGGPCVGADAPALYNPRSGCM